jgi:hypothetical protein
MTLNTRRLNKAIALLERMRDGTEDPEELVFTGRVGEQLAEIGNEFIAAITVLVGATMDMLDDVPTKDAPAVFRQRLEILLRRMLASELH